MAGLSLFMTNRHHYDFIVRTENGCRILTVECHLDLIHHRMAGAGLEDGTVELRVEGTRGHYIFSFSQYGNPFRELARLDTRYLGVEVTGGYNGVVIGLFASGSGRPSTVPADFDWFDYIPANPNSVH